VIDGAGGRHLWRGRGRHPFFAKATKHLNSRRLDCGTESNRENDSGAVCTNLASQIPAKAGTTIRALAGFKSGEMRGFQNGLPPSLKLRRTRKPELRTQKSCCHVIREGKLRALLSVGGDVCPGVALAARASPLVTGCDPLRGSGKKQGTRRGASGLVG
jgi:hypothetical protein